MKIKEVLDECFQDYKKTSMLISMTSCDWKCCKESNIPISVCQNSDIARQCDVIIDAKDLVNRYLKNPISKAVVFGGLEPMLQFDEIFEFIKSLRQDYKCNDDVVIYTGYYPEEIANKIEKLTEFKNIIIKFGRYVPNRQKKYDEVLGIDLISDNQFAKKIS